jgi:hypothetical protein
MLPMAERTTTLSQAFTPEVLTHISIFIYKLDFLYYFLIPLLFKKYRSHSAQNARQFIEEL